MALSCQKNDFLLSICIPSYNNSLKVRRLFDSFLPQLTSEVEILIRDDSANNEIEELIKQYSKKISIPLRYFKGKKEGLDKAIIFLTEEAKGEYIWWMGDDVLADGAVQRVLELIKEFPDISLIWLNSRDINDPNYTAFKLERDKFFDNRNQLLEKDVGLLGFISVTIFKREMALSGIEESKKYIGSAFVNLYLILYVLSRDGRFYFLNTPYVFSEAKLAGEARWYDSFEVFGINLFNIVQEFNDKFDRRSIKKALAFNFGNIWRAVLVERAMGFTTGFGSKTPKVKKMFKCYWNFSEFWLALPFFLMPRFMLKFFYKIFKIVKSKKS